jgi:hypothetical protein
VSDVICSYIQLYILLIEMGQDASGVLEQLNKDMILSCPSCKKLYNLNSRAPVMVCPNQHNYCEECLEEVIKAKKCF